MSLCKKLNRRHRLGLWNSDCFAPVGVVSYIGKIWNQFLVNSYSYHAGEKKKNAQGNQKCREARLSKKKTGSDQEWKPVFSTPGSLL